MSRKNSQRAPSGRREPPGKVRIIGGSLRGSRLPVPALPGLRPTPERVRETLFNWLAPHVIGTRCLDLFAGSGALGIEALSRGAAEAILVERDAATARQLRAEIARLKVSGGTVVAADALAWLAAGGAPFDIVFLDPPFEQDLWPAAIARLDAGAWLKPGAFLYVESPRAHVPQFPPTWSLWRQGNAGDLRFALYRNPLATAAIA